MSYSLVYAECHPPSSSRYTTPRFINDRERPSPFRPWSLSLEIAAAERRKAIARNDDYDELCYGDFDELLWEEFFYRTTEDAFNSELAAYSPLQDLQGVGIPRYSAQSIPALFLARWRAP